MNKKIVYIICPLVCLVLGFLSGVQTADSISTWYAQLNKPSWNPPNWLFGPVWSILYILMGVSLAMVLNSTSTLKTKAVIVFSVQLILNLAWSYIFFVQKNMGGALIEIIFLLIFIIVTIVSFYPIRKTASYLLLPYLCWVAFASFLNYTIYSLN